MGTNFLLRMGFAGILKPEKQGRRGSCLCRIKLKQAKCKTPWHGAVSASANTPKTISGSLKEEKMHRKTFMALVVGASITGMVATAHATPVNWIDWTSSSAGILTVDNQTINVSLAVESNDPSGNNLIYKQENGDYYFNNPTTNADGTYGDFTPSDIIELGYGGTFTLNFDREIVNPYFALVSVGSGWKGVSYQFPDPFTLITYGSNFWGYKSYHISGNTLTGNEFNGILQLHGSYTSLSFTVPQNEWWHGFNTGVADASPVLEPATTFLFGTGLVGLAGTRIRRKRRRGPAFAELN